MRFTKKIVLVTGAAGGIGSAICRRFADEGASVIVSDADAAGAQATAAAIRAVGAVAEAVVSDISTGEGCRALVQAVLELV